MRGSKDSWKKENGRSWEKERQEKPSAGGHRRDDIVRAVFPVLLWYAVSGLAVSVWEGIFGAGSAGTDASAVTGSVSLLLIPVFILLLRRCGLSDSRSGLRGRMRNRASRFWLAAAPLTGAALSVLYGRLTGLLRLTEHFSNETQERLLAAPLAIQITALCVLSPACEELLFRGLLYGNLKRAIPSVWAAVITSAVFAAVHGNPIQMIYAFPMGLLMQLFLRKEGGLEAPVAFHIAANLAAVTAEGILR